MASDQGFQSEQTADKFAPGEEVGDGRLARCAADQDVGTPVLGEAVERHGMTESSGGSERLHAAAVAAGRAGGWPVERDRGQHAAGTAGGHTHPGARFAAVMAGAAGYLLKQIGGRSLTDAIRQVAAGGSLMDPAVTGKLLERLRHPPVPDPRVGSLTAREREILDLIAEGLSNRQIGERLFLAEKTVKNYVSTLLSKLHMQRRTQAAVFGAEVRNTGSAPTAE